MKKKTNVITKIIFILFVIICTFSSPISVLASGNLAFSVGTTYSDGINTSKDARTACDKYAIAGYKSYYSTQPTVDIMTGTFKNGIKRMQSDILLFSGHGNYDHMAFNYRGLGGKYRTGIYYTDKEQIESSSTGYVYSGLKNMSHVQLVTFAGCETANQDNKNITLLSCNNGAKCAVGWTTSVNAGSHTEWLERYNDKLATGASVKNAIYYASAFPYDDNRVKNARVYGKSALIINTTKSISKSKSSEIEKLKYINIPEDINVIENNNINTSIIIDALKKEGIYLNSKDIKIEIHKITENNDFTIDLIELYNGIETNSSYIAFVEDGMLKNIVNNHKDSSSNNERKILLKMPTLLKLDTENIFTKAKKEATSFGATQIISQDGKYYYDYTTNTLKYIVFTEYYFDNTTTIGVSSYEHII